MGKGMKRILSIGSITVVFLLVSVSFSSVVNAEVVKESGGNYVNVTTEFCGIDGFKPNSVRLTKQESEELETIIDNFNNEIEKADNLDETIDLYKKMVLSLNEFDLIPGNVGVEKTQILVTRNEFKNFESLFKKSDIFNLNDNENMFCLISGQTDGFSNNQGPILSFLNLIKNLFNLIYLLGEKINSSILSNVGLATYFYLSSVLIFLNLLGMFYDLIPFGLMQNIGLSGFNRVPLPNPHDKEFFTNGEIKSFGLNGKVDWSGKLIGRLQLLNYDLLMSTFFVGIAGFTGINIQINPTNSDSHQFFLGTALLASIEDG